VTTLRAAAKRFSLPARPLPRNGETAQVEAVLCKRGAKFGEVHVQSVSYARLGNPTDHMEFCAIEFYFESHGP
jgi:hypothetical protein